MILNLLKQNLTSAHCSTLVAFSFEDNKKEKHIKLSHSGLGERLNAAIKDGMITGKLSEAVAFREINYHGYRHILTVGLGKEKEYGHEQVRQAFATAWEGIKALKASEVAVDLDGLIYSSKHAGEFTRAAVEGLTLAGYSFEELKSKGGNGTGANESDLKVETKVKADLKIKGKKKVSASKESKEGGDNTASEVTVFLIGKMAGDKTVKQGFDEGLILGSAVNFSRRLGDMPGNLMTPTLLGEAAIEGAKGTGIKVTCWDREKCIKENMGGLVGVSQGSDQEPRFIIMEYKGGKASQRPLVFVGKGLTFDCGGISIKPSASMEEMKYDMCGGANVIGTMLAIARLKLKINVIGLVPATENIVNGSATKPGDIHRARNGKTFEVNNTDAEGRLILADALSYASELNPTAIIDIATLTGAMIISLGNIYTGYFTRDKSLCETMAKAAEKTGELVWNMPLCDFHVKDMKGTFADLSNISSGKGAGSSTAAAFLEQFVGEGIPWVHFDIAGTGWALGGRFNYCPKKGASGVMIRTFVEAAKLLTKN